MTKKQIKIYILLILLHEFIQFIFYFNYAFLAVGWEKALARKLIVGLMIIEPVALFYSFKLKSESFTKIIVIINTLLFFISLVFAIFMPIVISQEAFDLYMVQNVYILNPAISLMYILFVSTGFLLIPRIKQMPVKKIMIVFVPVLLWVIIRLLFD